MEFSVYILRDVLLAWRLSAMRGIGIPIGWLFYDGHAPFQNGQLSSIHVFNSSICHGLISVPMHEVYASIGSVCVVSLFSKNSIQAWYHRCKQDGSPLRKTPGSKYEQKYPY